MSNRQLPLHHIDAELIPSLSRQAADMTSVNGRDAGIHAVEVPGTALLNIRGNVNNLSFVERIEAVTGLELPVTPNSNQSNEAMTLHWLGPTEWLLVLPEDGLYPSELSIGENASGWAVTDVTGGYTLINLQGPVVPLLLKKTCHYDFHLYPMGKSVQTNFAKAGCVIWRPDESTFSLLVRRSFADYIYRWIRDASMEYGFSFSTFEQK